MRPHKHSRFSRRRRWTRGFTLIEVLVAIVLIHVALLSLVAASAMLVRR
jgi:prepilin-type N-terminal cleavage/methylation domain-containing protein